MKDDNLIMEYVSKKNSEAEDASALLKSTTRKSGAATT